MTEPEIEFSRIGTTEQYPVSLETAKDHLRVDFSDDDERIKNLIKSVCSEAQHFIGKPVFETLWQSGAVTLDQTQLINIPYIQNAIAEDASSGAPVGVTLHVTGSSAKLELTSAYANPVTVMLVQQYHSEDLDLTLLLMVAFFYERRDLTRFSEQTINTLRKRMVYHRDAIIANGLH